MNRYVKWLPDLAIIAFAVLVGELCLRFTNWGNSFSLALLVIALGNFLIGVITKWLHNWSDTDLDVYKDSNENEKKRRTNNARIILKRLVGLAEIVLYAFFLVFHQITLLTGWFVIKAISGQWIDSEEKSSSPVQEGGVQKSGAPAREGAALAVFRLGIILSFVLAVIVAYFVTRSRFVDSPLYHAIDGVLPKY
ncbi:MAG: hypothetical protein G01um10148_875 [Parcubacteria group bacterium Gr01-1014_8]|nr:MAG: hypothetical protein G01um10148_875 [Parcubacteria group bacterium Gr01-1014_8]